jgi:hypothetical protein
MDEKDKKDFIIKIITLIKVSNNFFKKNLKYINTFNNNN